MTGYVLDENLPRRLTFTPALPVLHATDLAASPTDMLHWDHARQHDMAIVSKDADFSDRIMLVTPPPRIVRLAFGNLRLQRRSRHAGPGVAADRGTSAVAQAGDRERRSDRSGD